MKGAPAVSTRLLRAGVVAAGALVLALWPVSPAAVDRLYAEGLYPRLQHLLTAATNAIPIAVLDVVGLAMLAALVWLLTAAIRGRGVWRGLARFAIDLVVVASVLYVWFLAAWGLNYRRTPLQAHLDFDASRINREAVSRLANRGVFELNRLHPIAHALPWQGFDELRESLAPPFARARDLIGATWQPVAGRPKWSLLDWYFRRSGVDGVTNPFFLEIIVNHDVLPFERAVVLAHEWGHLGGWAHEAEASFVAWLTCVQSSAQHQYAAWVFLYPELVAHLARDERAMLHALLHTGPKRDFEAIRARILRASPIVRRAASGAYDRYLRANRVQEGIASYGRVVQLVAGTRFDEGWVPVRKR